MLGVLIIPAFLFIFFQNSFKNYYKLPVLGQIQQTNTLSNFDKTISVVIYPNTKQDTLHTLIFTNVVRIAESKDLAMLLSKKLPNFKINYYFFSNKATALKSKNIRSEINASEIASYFKEENVNAILVDNQGQIRGGYALLKGAYTDNDEVERLITEIKVLMEILASSKN